MQANVIIRMGAANYDCRVRGADGEFVRFDLRSMSKDQRRDFHREFMNTYRAATGAITAPKERRSASKRRRRVSNRNTKGM
jgi:hypothetical protein